MSAILASAISREHDTGIGHPEQAARFDAALKGAGKYELIENLATFDQIALCHDRAYVDQAENEIQSGARQLSTGDTEVSARSYDVACGAAGTVLSAVERVFTRSAQNAFCIVRPPGHHATPNRGMGFCLFNNIAIGARYAQRRYGAERVLIVDWDVHHGNGTQDIFYSDPSVLFFSTHQHPWYPGTGARNETGASAGEGTTINCPLPAGAGSKEIVGAFREELVPAAKKFQPDLVMISAGFDSRFGDPLGRFRLHDPDFIELTKIMMDLADQFCGGRLVSVLEGGYSLDGLERAVQAHSRALGGETPAPME